MKLQCVSDAPGTSGMYRWVEHGQYRVFMEPNNVVTSADEIRRLGEWLLETARLMTSGFIYVAPPATEEEREKLRKDWEAMYRGCPKRPCKIND